LLSVKPKPSLSCARIRLSIGGQARGVVALSRERGVVCPR
jgi:hypothetical protein